MNHEKNLKRPRETGMWTHANGIQKLDVFSRFNLDHLKGHLGLGYF